MSEHAQPKSFLAVAYAFFIIMTGTTLPTPLYAIYQEKFGFSAFMITVLFAVYALMVVAVLLLFGRTSDNIGRKPVLVIAAVASLASAIAFVLADGVALMMTGRLLSGVSAGLVTGTATATLLDLGGHATRARSATIAVAVNAAGLGAGTAMAGALAEWAPNPLYLSFIVNFVLTAVGLTLLLWFRSPETQPRQWRLRPQRPSVPPEIRTIFTQSSLAAGAGFAVTGVLTAVVSLFLVGELDIDNHALAGAVVGIALISVAFGQLIVKRMSDRVALPAGCVGLIVSSALIITALLFTTLLPLIAGAVVVGLSTGVCTGAGLRAISTGTPPDRRAATSSTFFAVLYTMLSVPVIAVGLLEKATDLITAGVTFAIVVALLSFGVLLSLIRRH